MSDRTSVEVSVSLPREFVEDELLPEYPAASNAPQAARMAIQNNIRRRHERISPREISDRMADIIEQTGSGRFENVQRAVIGDTRRVAQADSYEVVDEE